MRFIYHQIGYVLQNHRKSPHNHKNNSKDNLNLSYLLKINKKQNHITTTTVDFACILLLPKRNFAQAMQYNLPKVTCLLLFICYLTLWKEQI